MNDNDNNILIAQQGNCDVALVDGSKVLHYKDKDGNDQSLDIADLVNLTDGSNLFNGNTNLNVDWEISLPNLTDGSYMFTSCTGLTSFTGDLPNLENGFNMFSYCSKLTSFTADLPNLENGFCMFAGCASLTSFTGDLPSLTSGDRMFQSCSKLTSFTGDLPNLTSGDNMFYGCAALASFNAGTEGLKSLSNGLNMFYNCILDETSVLHILNTIPTYTSDTHKLHLGKRTNFLNSTEIATLLGATTPIAAKTDYKYKGWTITVTN